MVKLPTNTASNPAAPEWKGIHAEADLKSSGSSKKRDGADEELEMKAILPYMVTLKGGYLQRIRGAPSATLRGGSTGSEKRVNSAVPNVPSSDQEWSASPVVRTYRQSKLHMAARRANCIATGRSPKKPGRSKGRRCASRNISGCDAQRRGATAIKAQAAR